MDPGPPSAPTRRGAGRGHRRPGVPADVGGGRAGARREGGPLAADQVRRWLRDDRLASGAGRSGTGPATRVGLHRTRTRVRRPRRTRARERDGQADRADAVAPRQHGAAARRDALVHDRGAPLLPAVLRARGRLRPCFAGDPRATYRTRLGRHGPEDRQLRRPVRRLRPAPGAHRSRRTEALRHHGLPRAHGRARPGDPSHPANSGGSSFTEVFLDEVSLDDATRVGEVGAGSSVAMSTSGSRGRPATAAPASVGPGTRSATSPPRSERWATRSSASGSPGSTPGRDYELSAGSDAARRAEGVDVGAAGSLRELQWVGLLREISDTASMLLEQRCRGHRRTRHLRLERPRTGFDRLHSPAAPTRCSATSSASGSWTSRRAAGRQGRALERAMTDGGMTT